MKHFSHQIYRNQNTHPHTHSPNYNIFSFWEKKKKQLIIDMFYDSWRDLFVCLMTSSDISNIRPSPPTPTHLLSNIYDDTIHNYTQFSSNHIDIQSNFLKKWFFNLSTLKYCSFTNLRRIERSYLMANFWCVDFDMV